MILKKVKNPYADTSRTAKAVCDFIDSGDEWCEVIPEDGESTLNHANYSRFWQYLNRREITNVEVKQLMGKVYLHRTRK